MTFIYDSDFEADLSENDYEEEIEMTLGERLSIMIDEYYIYRNKRAEDYDENYVDALFRDLTDLLDDCDEEFYNREVNYLIFKLLNTHIGHEYIKTRPVLIKCWKIHGEELLINIDLMSNVNFMWENIRTAILDFFNDANYIFVEFGLE